MERWRNTLTHEKDGLSFDCFNIDRSTYTSATTPPITRNTNNYNMVERIKKSLARFRMLSLHLYRTRSPKKCQNRKTYARAHTQDRHRYNTIQLPLQTPALRERYKKHKNKKPTTNSSPKEDDERKNLLINRRSKKGKWESVERGPLPLYCSHSLSFSSLSIPIPLTQTSPPGTNSPSPAEWR